MTRTKAIAVLMTTTTDAEKSAALRHIVKELDAADDRAENLLKQVEYWKLQASNASSGGGK
jgi:hypothetical protein